MASKTQQSGGWVSFVLPVTILILIPCLSQRHLHSL